MKSLEFFKPTLATTLAIVLAWLLSVRPPPVVRSDEKLTAFLELESAIRVSEPIHIDIADSGPKLDALKIVLNPA